MAAVADARDGTRHSHGAHALVLHAIWSGCTGWRVKPARDSAFALHPQVREAGAALAAREARVAEAEALAAKNQEREEALQAAEAAAAQRARDVEEAHAAANQRQQQLDELYDRVKADSSTLRDQAQGFEERRGLVVADLQVRAVRPAMKARDVSVALVLSQLNRVVPSASALLVETATPCPARPQAREESLAAREQELASLQDRLQEDRTRSAAEAARLEERARESLRVVREAEADYLSGRERLEALEREVRLAVGAGAGHRRGWAGCLFGAVLRVR